MTEPTGSVDLVSCEVLQRYQRAGAADLEFSERRKIEHGDALTSCDVFSGGYR